MSKNKGHKNYFQGDIWFEKKVDQRTRSVLVEKQIAFAKEHKSDTDEELLDYLRQTAAKLGYTPNAGEIIGGEYIAARLGSWNAAVQASGLKMPGKPREFKARPIYKEEFKRQAVLFKKERLAKKEEKKEMLQARKDLAKVKYAEQADRDWEWSKHHRTDTDEELLAYLRQCAETLGHSPVKAEVEGSSYILKRFGSWPLALELAKLPLPQGMKPPRPKDINDYRKLKKQRMIAEAQSASHNTPETSINESKENEDRTSM